MPRPLPIVPRLPLRLRPPDEGALLGCPCISPQWELSALQALIKPQTGQAIRHLPARQNAPADLGVRVKHALDLAADRLGYCPTLHWPEAGDYLFLSRVGPHEAAESRALALLLSRQLPGLWLVLGRLLVRDGLFYRRERGFRLKLVPATNVHLPRPVRAALSGVL